MTAFAHHYLNTVISVRSTYPNYAVTKANDVTFKENSFHFQV